MTTFANPFYKFSNHNDDLSKVKVLFDSLKIKSVVSHTNSTCKGFIDSLKIKSVVSHTNSTCKGFI